MVMFYKKWKRYNEIQLTKNKLHLNIRKMTIIHPRPTTPRPPLYSCPLSMRTSVCFPSIIFVRARKRKLSEYRVKLIIIKLALLERKNWFLVMNSDDNG